MKTDIADLSENQFPAETKWVCVWLLGELIDNYQIEDLGQRGAERGYITRPHPARLWLCTSNFLVYELLASQGQSQLSGVGVSCNLVRSNKVSHTVIINSLQSQVANLILIILTRAWLFCMLRLGFSNDLAPLSLSIQHIVKSKTELH